MARLTRDIKALIKNTAGLTVDVATAGLTLTTAVIGGGRDIINLTTKQGLKDIATYSCDIIAGNDIGTMDEKLTAALTSGKTGEALANYILEMVHGDKAYREQIAAINRELEVAEKAFDEVLLKAELAEMNVAAAKEARIIEAKTIKLQAE